MTNTMFDALHGDNVQTHLGQAQTAQTEAKSALSSDFISTASAAAARPAAPETVWGMSQSTFSESEKILGTTAAAGVITAAIGRPVGMAALGPAMGLFGGLTTGLMSRDVGMGVEWGIRESGRFGMKAGGAIGVTAALLTWGGYEAYEYFHKK